VRAPIFRLLLLRLAAAAVWLPAAATEPPPAPELLAERASGSFEIESESRVVLSGLGGRLSLRLAAPGQLRFAARSLTEPREDRALALWLEDRTLRLAPPAGREAERLLVEVGVPPELEVEIQAAESQIDLSGLSGGVLVRGSALEITASALGGAASFEIQRGKLGVRGAGDLTLTGEGLDARPSRG
jgi:hypothetical protein